MNKLLLFTNVGLVVVTLVQLGSWFFTGEAPSDFSVLVAFSYIGFSCLLEALQILFGDK